MWDAELPSDTPRAIVELVRHAQQFSCATQGAALLYNLMLAEERSEADLEPTDATSVENYRLRIDEWTATATRIHLADWAARINDFWDCVLDNSVHIPPETRVFLDSWANIVAGELRHLATSPDARDLIRGREIQHKRGQARLANKKRLHEWRGEAGTRPLEYRWPQVQRMLADIADGLDEPGSEGGHAVA